MHSFTIRQDYYTKIPVFHFRDLDPTLKPAIGLNGFSEWRPNGKLDPFVKNYGSIRPQTDGFKISRNLHIAKVADFSIGGSSCRLT